jgi:hypothetical protein
MTLSGLDVASVRTRLPWRADGVGQTLVSWQSGGAAQTLPSSSADGALKTQVSWLAEAGHPRLSAASSATDVE